MDELDKARVQLAGCLMASEGAKQSAFVGDYGWSPAYQSVIELRKLYDNAQQNVQLPALRRGLVVSVWVNIVLLVILGLVTGGR